MENRGGSDRAYCVQYYRDNLPSCLLHQVAATIEKPRKFNAVTSIDTAEP